MRRIKIGAEYFSSSLIPSIPLQTIVNCANQKTMKQENSIGEVPSQFRVWEKGDSLIILGKRRKIASPPIQVSIPYHPQPTRARRRAGTCAPRIPKEDRAKTGKEIPYLVPRCPVRTKGKRRMTLAATTVAIPCHHAIPRSTRLPAR